MADDVKTPKAIFMAVLEKAPTGDRSTLLDEACAGDPILRQRVDALFEAHDHADALLDQPPVQGLAAAYDRKAKDTQRKEAVKPDEAVKTDDAVKLDFLGPSSKPGSLGRLDHYEVIEIIGKGGFGVVLKAFDEKLQRVVAIKVLAPALAGNASARQRFVREARAAAAVTHENVMAIYAVEDDGPVPYLVMQCIVGRTLQEKLDATGPLELKTILRIGMQIAEGLAAAHRQGLIHRDIKPANILLENSVERVKITDFGLARAVDDASLTQSGYIAGTPMYMSPEQARGEALDYRTDLFSLGSVLYALCSGHPPFRAESTMAVMKRVCDDEPRRLRESNPAIPEWLAAIVSRLQQKNPGARFATAREVADVLSRCLAQVQSGAEPSAKVRALGPPARAWRGRWVGIPAAAALVVAAVGIAWFFFIHNADRNPRQPPANDSGAQSWRPRAPLTPEELAALPDPLKDWRRGIPPEALAMLGDAPPPGLIGLLGYGPFRLPRRLATHWPVQSPDGRLLALPNMNTVVLYDAATGVVIRTLTHQKTGRALRGGFSPDGKLYACGSENGGGIRIWDVASGKETKSVQSEGHTYTTLFADDRQVVFTGSEGLLNLWDFAAGKEPRTLGEHRGGITQMAFSPDRTRLVTAGYDGIVKVWDWPGAALPKALEGHLDRGMSVAYSADGALLAAGGPSKVLVWDAATFKLLHKPEIAGDGLLAFTPDGQTLVAAPHFPSDLSPPGQKRFFTRWDVKTGDASPPLEVPGPGSSVVGLLSGDGRTVYLMNCTPPEPRLGAFDAVKGQDRFPTQYKAGTTWCVAFSPDGRWLASAGDAGQVCLWDLTTQHASGQFPAPARILTGHEGHVWSVAFSPDGQILASAGQDETIRLWNVADGQELPELAGNSFPVARQGDRSLPIARMAFSPDGETLAAVSLNGGVNLWNVKTGQPKEPLRWHFGPVLAVAFSPDGRWLATGGADKSVQLIDRASGQRVHPFRSESPMTGLAFSPDSKTLSAICAAPKPSLLLWDITTKKALPPRTGHTGSWVATASPDGTVRLWDPAAGAEESPTFNFLQLGTSSTVAFSPSGRHLAVGLDNGMIAILATPAPRRSAGPPSGAQPSKSPSLWLTGQDRVELDKTAGMLDLNGEFTVEMWTKLGTGLNYLVGDETWEGVAKVDRAYGWVLRIQEGQRMNFTVAIDGRPEWTIARGDPIVLDHDWHHLAISKSREGASVFLDGKSYLHLKTSNRQYMKSPFNMFLGPACFTAERPVNCHFKAFRVSGKQLYSQPFTPPAEFTKTDDTLLLLDFSVNKGNKLPDLSGHGRHGTIQGGSWSSSEPARQ